jgi:Flp pilus assembly CpaE family ATPase
VADAVENSVRMEENLWTQLVTTSGNLHILHSGRVNPSLRIDGAQMQGLIAFMRHHYQALCFDLSGNLEKYSIEIMLESKRVLLVCTPEKSSLLSAREKLEFLRGLELDGRVAVVLNRCEKRPLFTVPQVEDMLGMPVLQEFPNDYLAVNNAIADASWMPPNSDLGKKFALFADVLLGRTSPEAVTRKKKFLDFFALTPPKQSV